MTRWALPLSVALAAAVPAACDPVHSSNVSALGGEVAGVRPGPTHRAGQPCTVCHDGAMGDPPEFSVAGTVFQAAGGTAGLQGATVSLTGADGKTFATTTNGVGNFYLTPSEFAPKYPMHVSVTYGGTTVTMQSHVGWAASCGWCHVDPAGPDSPGHVYFDVPAAGVP